MTASMRPLPAPTAVVADDERLMRDQIVARLKEAWPELLIVGEASNGREAIDLVRSLRPDVVFLDISMPGTDGIEAARALAGQAHVVFVTAHDEYAIRAFEQGAVDYVLKPAEPARLALTCSACGSVSRRRRTRCTTCSRSCRNDSGRAACSRASICAGCRPASARRYG